MLTSDLLRVARRGPLVVPRYLTGAERERLSSVASDLIAAVEGAKGKKRDAVDAALDAIDHEARDRLAVQGLKKLLLDRCELAPAPGLEPEELREKVFALAADSRRALGPRESFDRSTVLDRAAHELGIDVAELEERLLADLKGNERLLAFRRIGAEELLQRYDVALAQGVLLKATRVQIAISGEAPGRTRQLFRAARFRGLLHRVTRVDDGYLVELDGPLSLFSAVQKYGLQLALFLPALLRCQRWRLRADLLWGKTRKAARFELGPEQGLVPHDKRVTGVAPQLDKLVEGFRKLDSGWTVEQNDDILALPGEAACVPDLVFTNAATGEQVYLEAFGFWSRKAVFDRVETLARAKLKGMGPARIILCAGQQLRVSQELLDDDAQGQIYVYKSSIRPKAILERLEAGTTPRH